MHTTTVFCFCSVRKDNHKALSQNKRGPNQNFRYAYNVVGYFTPKTAKFQILMFESVRHIFELCIEVIKIFQKIKCINLKTHGFLLKSPIY